MRIRVLSDLHLEHHAPPDGLSSPDAGPADVVVLAGDIGRGPDAVRWARRAFPDVPVLFVPGNHEYYDRPLDATLPALEKAGDRIPARTRAATDLAGTYVLQRTAMRIGEIQFLGCTFWTGFGLFPGENPAFRAGRTVEV